jgi:membrane protein DedA with SNARE-associated domain
MLYLLILLGMLLEGELVVFGAAFLVNRDAISWLPTLIIVLIGTWGGNLLWYLLGRHQNLWPAFIRKIANRVSAPLDDHLRRRPFHTILMTKFTYGLHRAVLLRAGAIGLPLRTFIRSDLFAGALWLSVVAAVVYFSSFSLSFLHHYFRSAEILLLLAFIIFILVEKLFVKISPP